jgi:hypothetical protein
MADAAENNFHQYLAGLERWNVELEDFERTARLDEHRR